MAKQTVNIGTSVNDGSGDPARTAFNKLNQNDTELYNFIGGAANTTTLPASLPVAKGGTGATTVAAARTNLGLGTAATATLTTSNEDSTLGRVMKIGDLGIGIGANNLNQMAGSTLPLSIGLHPNGKFLRITGGDATGHGAGVGATIGLPSGTYLCQYLHYGAATNAHIMVYPMNVRHDMYHGNLTLNDGSKTVKRLFKLLDDQNTTTDANGFIKAASPIVELYSDRIELNDEAKQQEITFEKLGTGDYLIKGSSGFAQTGWYVETPKDANGNVLFSVIYETLENGDISVKTYKKKFDLETASIVADLDNPVDITAGRWINLRLQELPQPEIEVIDEPEQ